MIFLFVLVVATVVSALVQAALSKVDIRGAARWGMALAFCVAGVTHWLNPGPFVQHLPPWLALREPLVAATGVIEVVLGIAIAMAGVRHRGVLGGVTAAYLLAVWPGNIYVAMADVDVDGQPGGLYPWVRVPLQLVFIVWVLSATQTPSTGGASRAKRAAPAAF